MMNLESTYMINISFRRDLTVWDRISRETKSVIWCNERSMGRTLFVLWGQSCNPRLPGAGSSSKTNPQKVKLLDPDPC